MQGCWCWQHACGASILCLVLTAAACCLLESGSTAQLPVCAARVGLLSCATLLCVHPPRKHTKRTAVPHPTLTHPPACGLVRRSAQAVQERQQCPGFLLGAPCSLRWAAAPLPRAAVHCCRCCRACRCWRLLPWPGQLVAFVWVVCWRRGSSGDRHEVFDYVGGCQAYIHAALVSLAQLCCNRAGPSKPQTTKHTHQLAARRHWQRWPA